MQLSIVFCVLFMVRLANAGLLDVPITKQESGGEKIIHESDSKSKDGEPPLIHGERHIDDKKASKEVQVHEKVEPQESESSGTEVKEIQEKLPKEEENNIEGQNENTECNCENEMGMVASETSGEEKTDIGVLRPRTVIRAKRWGCCDCCCCGPTGPPVTGMPCGCCGCGWGK